MITIIVCGAITVAMLAIGFATWTVTKKPKPETPVKFVDPIVEALVVKVIDLVDIQPDSWSTWGVYKNNGAMTGFEYQPDNEDTKVCRFKIEKSGTLTYMTAKVKKPSDKDEDKDKDTLEFVKSPIDINSEQQERLRIAYERLKCERLIRMIDRIDLKKD